MLLMMKRRQWISENEKGKISRSSTTFRATTTAIFVGQMKSFVILVGKLWPVRIIFEGVWGHFWLGEVSILGFFVDFYVNCRFYFPLNPRRRSGCFRQCRLKCTQMIKSVSYRSLLSPVLKPSAIFPRILPGQVCWQWWPSEVWDLPSCRAL